ncbi:MAG: response regulator [Verrucomicrobia bacterium]|nr:response regulator [Verrucomicrobiota bacterium]
MEKKVLLVDDEKTILSVLEQVLNLEGYTPFVSSDGVEALELIQEEKIRVCFLDLRMPAMDGIELCRQVRAADSEAKVFALSGFVDAYDQGELREVGFSDYFHKPFNIDEILNACRDSFEVLAKISSSADAKPE